MYVTCTRLSRSQYEEMDASGKILARAIGAARLLYELHQYLSKIGALPVYKVEIENWMRDAGIDPADLDEVIYEVT